MNRLVYKDGVWSLTVDGIHIPNHKVVHDGLKMRREEDPTVEIFLDEVDISGVVVIGANDEV